MEETKPHFASSQNVHIDEAYVSWIEELKGRYKKAQIKSAVKVNSEQLLFNWQLGRDLVVRRAEEHVYAACLACNDDFFLASDKGKACS